MGGQQWVVACAAAQMTALGHPAPGMALHSAAETAGQAHDGPIQTRPSTAGTGS